MSESIEKLKGESVLKWKHEMTKREIDVIEQAQDASSVEDIATWSLNNPYKIVTGRSLYHIIRKILKKVERREKAPH
ncbi:MAG: hypothetical protein Tp136SUR676911_46 [Prokaryotic dsDNA virus sp.]|jgi:hypothetical protein|nr:MAG: hypothetical protein Tp136SUR676911_46 [Prokaryotic dsDNA virus sp.]|tara:strand:+ start:29836 stop:30066 length:231 start_codon:yes stop_codon:yes gene_type:complete